jgi:hypothetical protein
MLQRATLGSPDGDPSKCKLSFHRFHRPLSKCSTCRLSTRANIFLNEFDPKDTKIKRTFHGVSRHFHPFKVPSKVDAGKLCIIWAQWTWKPRPRSIGFDADENGQPRQAQQLLFGLITPCSYEYSK